MSKEHTMFSRYKKKDARFQADEWSAGYFISQTSRAKGLPPARQTRNGNEAQRSAYDTMLMTQRSMPPGHNFYEQRRPTPPKRVQHEATSLGGTGGLAALHSPLHKRTQQRNPQLAAASAVAETPPRQNNQSSRYVAPANQTTHAFATDNSRDAYQASLQVNRQEPKQETQDLALSLISARGDNPFVVPLQKIVDLRSGIKKSRGRRRGQQEEGGDEIRTGTTPPGTPTSQIIYANENGEDDDEVYDGTLARDPSAEFTLDIDGDGDVDPDEQAHASKVGRFEWVTDPDERARLRIYEGKVVLAGVFINQHRHDMGVLEPSFAKMSSRDMTNILAEAPNFSEWLDALKERAANIPQAVWDTDDSLNNYLDIDGDGAIDAEELIMQHRIGKYEWIENVQERTAARLAEGQYIYALDFLWNNRDIMWVIDRRFGTMNQKEILDDMLGQPDFQMMLQNLRGKASSLRLGGSKQLRECLGGSKNYMPDKAQLIRRRTTELNHACRKTARDFICDKVDLEATFRKKNLGYSSPSGWGSVYMQNLSMLRGGVPDPGARAILIRQQRQAALEGIEDEYVAYGNGR